MDSEIDEKENKERMKLEREYGRMPDDTEVAKSLNMPLDEYFRTLQYATSSNPVRLEDFRNSKYADSDLNITECIADPKAKSPLAVLEEKDTKPILILKNFSSKFNKQYFQ